MLIGRFCRLVLWWCKGGDAADSRRSRAVVIDARSRTQARFIGTERLAAQQGDLWLPYCAGGRLGWRRLSWPGHKSGMLCQTYASWTWPKFATTGPLSRAWHAVGQVESLDLRGNRLHPVRCTANICFPKLRVLVLNGTRLSWENAVSRSFQMQRLLSCTSQVMGFHRA